MVTDTRSRFEEHLMAALDEAESGEATYHIRQGLQLIQFEGPRDGTVTDTARRRREREGRHLERGTRSDGSRGESRRSLARLFAESPLLDED